MRTVLFLAFVCCIGAENIRQPKRLQTSKLGDNVTIECYLPKKDYNNIAWYKQDMGMHLQIVSKSYIYLTRVDFSDGYDDGRFSVTIKTGIYHLHISLTKKEDIATYFCGVITLGELDFGPGTFLMLNEHTSTIVLQEPISDEIHIGDNVTIMCRVQTVDQKCKGEHYVYWFREAAEETGPGIIYTDDRKKHGEIYKDDCSTQTCIYSLTKRNLSLSDAGTYYCAVLECGRILFGNGTSLEISSILDSDLTTSPLFLILVLSNTISALIMILLMAVRCKDQGSSSADRSRYQETSEGAQVGDAGALTYTSVSFSCKSQSSRGAKQHNISQHADVYSQIRS
ncbi:novel immune-type receptor 8 isoform X2 [Puntigrus tetrazona]|uniref:novel immune-type receptor 8 isoform X2 n=1 Tax=Puntigrus tetrazona TaxID=1606681 RepID=UPI001C899EDA|nr:novel immune-type receptor 8 isoform X2 [Puntigrus tetrazona]